MGAEVFASPVVVLIVLVLVVGASAIHYRNDARRPVVSVRRLVAGYFAVVLCSAAIAAFSSYVPQGEALAKWHVPPEDYWAVQLRAYFVEFTLMACVVLLGVAFVGLPIVFGLARRGWATVPSVVGSSLLVSAVAAVLMSAGDSPAFRHLGFTIKYLVGQHLLLALSFCLAVGLPWRREASR
ncbi:MAG: hypothetical protein HYX47_03980 [Burkholderiales bacterium]|nr:hypothetical protein [Burkholderiales bacterium]